ncbi:CRISPR-associated protein [Tessaracoccus bendigoensis DSM 12906]|uniref:CRISPR-associated protein n=1 Tax=Tessaracoccus bendigoensis DSM 12906 TaxID=1123357 RepID=A0A1M6JKM4_9ACTN|nr:hypothetical protein [Tessaracoccus bendigoensis]SHJ47271.1 CRISPR-associated protein [Tessaracoccus bendigoensis DSM 12906]
MPVSKDRFVNPYAFVPLPQRVVRCDAPGHVSAPGDGRLTGRLTVEWTLETPMLLPAKAKEEGWLRPDGSVRVPGSAMKGSIRSLHETLFNGCLRVFDSDFLPGYRMPATSDADAVGGPGNAEGAWGLGVVTRSRDGVPLEIARCEKVEWVEARSLLQAYRSAHIKGLPRTGDVVGISGNQTWSNLRSAVEVRQVSGVSKLRRIKGIRIGRDDVAETPASGSVLLITSTSVRKETREDGSPADCFWATGRLAAGDPVDVSAEAAQAFKAACAGSRDRQELHQKEQKGKAPANWRGQSCYEAVTWPNRVGPRVGERALATGFLHPGDVVWISLDEDATRVTGIRLSKIWRQSGTGAAGERVPVETLPCWSVDTSAKRPRGRCAPGGLCLSCVVFGSADTSSEIEGEGRQDAYAGHVRFGAARSRGPVTVEAVSLAPLGSPRMGAGVFYLKDGGKSSVKGDVTSQWGSDVDTPDGRELRGRKFYWHVNPARQAEFWTGELNRKEKVLPRYEARPKHAERLTRSAELVPAGTVLTQEITFEGLDKVSLQSLLVAVDPGRLLKAPRGSGVMFATHLGGGKPFGLGAASVRLTCTAWEAESRYQVDLKMAELDSEDITSECYRALDSRAGSLRHIQSVARLLDLDGLGQWRNHVTYPPGATWDEIDLPDKRGYIPFDESYRFFGEANGQRLADHNRRWCPLPDVTKDNSDGAMDLPIIRKKGRS